MHTKLFYLILAVLLVIALGLFGLGVWHFLNPGKQPPTDEPTATISPSSSTPSPSPSPLPTAYPQPVQTVSTNPSVSSPAGATHVLLSVPYVNETPENKSGGAWKNACEEASIVMVDEFFKGEHTANLPEAETFMQMLFDTEDKLYGSNANSDAERNAYLINNYASFKGVIVTNPTLDQIKKELRDGHPVIAFHYGFDLKNSNIPFRLNGPSYHSTVVVGYDDTRGEFIVNDPGDEIDGADHTYAYGLYMNSLHDFNYDNGKADGPARVIFTSR